MTFLPAIVIVVAIAAIAKVVIRRARLKREERELNERIASIASFEKRKADEAKVALSDVNNNFFNPARGHVHNTCEVEL